MTVNDIGVPGQPATNLTAWQAAVRDAINSNTARSRWQIQSGRSAGLTTGVGMVTLIFPQAFAVAPALLLTPATRPTGVGGAVNQYAVMTEYSAATTAATVYCMNAAGTALPDGTPVDFHWLAIALYP